MRNHLTKFIVYKMIGVAEMNVGFLYLGLSLIYFFFLCDYSIYRWNDWQILKFQTHFRHMYDYFHHPIIILRLFLFWAHRLYLFFDSSLIELTQRIHTTYCHIAIFLLFVVPTLCSAHSSLIYSQLYTLTPNFYVWSYRRNKEFLVIVVVSFCGLNNAKKKQHRSIAFKRDIEL